MLYKKCLECRKIKPLTKFDPAPNIKDGYKNECRQCSRKTKVCCRCKQEKNKSEFYPCKSKTSGLHNYCKSCLKNYVVTTRRERRLARTVKNSQH